MNEISQKLQSRSLTLFRVKLDGKHVIPRNRGGKGKSVDAKAGSCLFISDVEAMHEIEAA